ncbi:hypothetical protein M3Y98_00377700 [Aphelenchoides besseyi]|nr:hypothetical protein M3Y98_00377700 [Aphelenchoides besseyi]KAI6201881.1 hypothetical protein M3Y96_00889300 [Aphelenchoides besseyi]
MTQKRTLKFGTPRKNLAYAVTNCKAMI